MESTEQNMAGLADLHESLVDASEQLAAFISTGKSGEVAIDSLIRAADKTLVDLTAWRRGLKGVLADPALRSYLDDRDLH
jgi:hypothetical protein